LVLTDIAMTICSSLDLYQTNDFGIYFAIAMPAEDFRKIAINQ